MLPAGSTVQEARANLKEALELFFQTERDSPLSPHTLLADTHKLWHIAMWTGFMRNVTLAMEEELIERGREYARRHGVSFNALIRDQLRRLVYRQSDWTEETFRTMDAAAGGSGGRTWRRSDLYDG